MLSTAQQLLRVGDPGQLLTCYISYSEYSTYITYSACLRAYVLPSFLACLPAYSYIISDVFGSRLGCRLHTGLLMLHVLQSRPSRCSPPWLNGEGLEDRSTTDLPSY